MQRQPGFIHFRFVRSLFSPNVYTNIAEWEDRESHDRVIQSPEFVEHIKALGAVATPGPELHEIVYEGDPIEIRA
jgi:quinol monooxygenase YgiN